MFFIGKQMAGFGLINMNGRLYDPYLQRFLSPDNVVQSPFNAQSYNRYTYCLNNPMMYTDPSGYTWKIFKPFVKAANWIWDNRKAIIKDIGIAVIITVVIVAPTIGGMILGGYLAPAACEFAVLNSFVVGGGILGLIAGDLTWTNTKDWIKDWEFWRDWKSGSFFN